MQDEYLDIVNEKDEVIGKTSRNDAHIVGHIHRVVHFWIFSRSGKILFQLRSKYKKTCPNMWDISAAGHVVCGETPYKTAKREVVEELGLKLEPIFIDKYYDNEEASDREMVYLYYAVCDENVKIKLDKQEVEKFEWVDISQTIEKIIKGQITSTPFIYTEVPKIYNKLIFK